MASKRECKEAEKLVLVVPKSGAWREGQGGCQWAASSVEFDELSIIKRVTMIFVWLISNGKISMCELKKLVYYCHLQVLNPPLAFMP